MNCTIVIYETPDNFAARSGPDQASYWAGIRGYLQALQQAGVFVGGAGLQLPGTGKTLRYQQDRRLVQDGPFAETKEQLGGFFIISVPDMNAAMEWAARVPQWPGRVVEVRPNLVPME
jgi:hypothetical protein